MPNHPTRLPRHFRRLVSTASITNCCPPGGINLEQYINDQGEKVMARQLTADSITVVSVWCQGQPVVEHDALDYDMTFQALNVPTRDGGKRASQGDYVVKMPDGSFDVQKAYEFRSRFREV